MLRRPAHPKQSIFTKLFFHNCKCLAFLDIRVKLNRQIYGVSNFMLISNAAAGCAHKTLSSLGVGLILRKLLFLNWFGNEM